LQALDQKEAEDMMRLLLGESFKEALMQQWVKCGNFVDAAGVFEKRARWCVDNLTPYNPECIE
jgi:hypothetical protein